MHIEDYLNKVSLWDLANGIPLPDESVDLILTSPPYFSLRSYKLEPSVWGGKKDCSHLWQSEIIAKSKSNWDTIPEMARGSGKRDTKEYPSQGQFCFSCSAFRGCLGLEPTFELYLNHLLGIFDEVKRVLRKSGTCWVNIGDSYSGGVSSNEAFNERWGNSPGRKAQEQARIKVKNTNPKSMLCIPERFVIGMIERGWVLRNKICWAKQILFEDGLTLGSVMPSSVKDRFNVTWEPVYFFTKSPKYYFNLDAVRVKNSLYSHPMGKDGSFSINTEAPTAPTWGKEGSQSLRGKTFKRYTREALNASNYQGKFSGLEEAEKFNSPRARTQRKRKFEREDEIREVQGKQYGGNVSDYYKGCAVRGNPNGKNPGSVWQINPEPLDLPHFASFPTSLCTRPILAGCPPGGIVCDIFAGIGSAGIEALRLGRKFIGFDLSEEYCKIANKRLETYRIQENLFNIDKSLCQH